ncbi:MAG: penicillin-binding transpeptidase domain-containing protein [bacterium]|nr:penicillin-binding transpeptidase domain-containing protein [bacterium]
MNKYFSFLFVIMINSAIAHNITTTEYELIFKRFSGCFILFDLNRNKIVSMYNPHNNCNQQIAANSTFKIPLSLMAFNERIINPNSLFKWHGEQGVLPEHERDQTPYSWLKYSVVWVSQQLTPKIGEKRIKYYLADFKYGNQDFRGDPGQKNGLTHAWLASSLKISPMEQLYFLNAMLKHKLSVSDDAIKFTEANMYLDKLPNGAKLYGKTGSGRHGRNERMKNPSTLRDGWFVGFIKQNKQSYIYVSDLTDKVPPISSDKAYGGQLIKPITLQLLNDFFGK